MDAQVMVLAPEIIVGGGAGRHNEDPAAVQRVVRGRQYRNLSTVCVIPAIAPIAPRVVSAWWELMVPMNQRFERVFVTGLEVADAYNAAIETVLANPVLSKYSHVLTLEQDNLPPPRGLIMLCESIGDFAAVGGLYWGKGEDGQPMIFGDPGGAPGFRPQVPLADRVQECQAVGMGFTLFDLDVFRDERVPRPWFRTVQGHWPEYGAAGYSQDLYFFHNIRRLGYRVACDTRVKVGHYDDTHGIVW
jgi:hypothetical protein